MISKRIISYCEFSTVFVSLKVDGSSSVNVEIINVLELKNKILHARKIFLQLEYLRWWFGAIQLYLQFLDYYLVVVSPIKCMMSLC